MDPEGFPDFGPILEEACKEQLKEVLPENLLEPLKVGFSELFRLCQTPEDELILKKCFRVVKRVGIPLKIPKARIELPVHQILRLLHLGFRLGKVDSRFEIRINSGQRVPMLDGSPMPEDDWQEPMPCVLKHEALSVLYQSGQEALVYLENNPPDDKKQKILKQQFRKKLEPVFYGTVPPSPSRLRRPPAVPLGLSLFDQPEFPGDSMLTEMSKQVLKLQKMSQVPSLFNPEQSDLLRDFQSTLVLLLDISASTSEQSLFKVSQIACSSLMTLLRRKLKKTQIFVIPYNDLPSRPLETLEAFIPPAGTTNYEAAFASAQECIREEKNPGMVINLTDGLPDRIDKACRAGSWFPRRGISYSQIVFGHVDHQDELIEELMIREGLLPKPMNSSRFEKYISYFTQVAEACQGSQMVIWMVDLLPQALLALTDLSLATQWLLQDPVRAEELEQKMLIHEI
jgi:uncharacterized protein YegL